MTGSPREQLYALIQAHAGNPEVTSAPPDAVLTGFLVVAEWDATDGERWISKCSGDAFRQLPPWRERGYAAEVVQWGETDDDEDESE